MKTFEEPAWVADEDIWDKAKSEVDKSKAPPESYYAVVTSVYKNMGGRVKPGKKTEADSTSSMPQFTRAGVKKECEVRFLVNRIREAAGSPAKGGSVFEVYLIEEGLGNMKDLFYYPSETIAEAAAVFKGKKIYADHPSEIEEETRPERSVRDILGYFQDVEAVESEDGRTCLKGTVKIVGGEKFDWARSLMQEAVDYSKAFQDQEFVGLSVNASGEADEVDIEDMVNDSSIPDSAKLKLQKAVAEGAKTIRKVSAITDAVSCDLVTEAGAGGKVLAMIEQEKEMRTKKEVKAKESEMKHSEESENEDGAPPADKKENPPADPKGGHPDADQDKAMIGDMMKKYMGKKEGEEVDESESEMAKQALKHAEEMGYEGDEKIACAGYGMKMMKHAAQKHAEAIKQSEDESKQKHSEGDESETEEAQKSPDQLKPKESAMVAKLQKENLELQGRVAKLEEKDRKVNLEKYLDKKLAESKLPRAATKKFRESVKVLVSEKDINEKWEIFEGAYTSATEAAPAPLYFGVEKVSEASQDDGGAIDLTKCLR